MKINKTLLKTVSVLAVAFAAAAIHGDGYNIFDREDGGNVLCAIDPGCRSLTPGEIKMAGAVFGDTTDYKSVKIFNHQLLPQTFMRTKPIFMWRGNIYAPDTIFRSADYSKDKPDYSRAQNVELQMTLLHEMTHVSQYQNDTKYLVRRFSSLSMHDHDFLYGYQIDDHKYYTDFNYEQQAQIIEDYYGYQAFFRDKTQGLKMSRPADFSRKFNREARDMCKMLDKYTQVVSQLFPQKLEPGCAMYRPYDPPPADPFADKPGSPALPK
jgi:hypothetical protein